MNKINSDKTWKTISCHFNIVHIKSTIKKMWKESRKHSETFTIYNVNKKLKIIFHNVLSFSLHIFIFTIWTKQRKANNNMKSIESFPLKEEFILYILHPSSHLLNFPCFSFCVHADAAPIQTIEKEKWGKTFYSIFFFGEKEKEDNCCCRCCLGWKKFGVESVRSFSTNKDNKIRSIWLDDDVVFISSRNGNKKVVSGFFLFVSEGAVCFSPFPQFYFRFFPTPCPH